MLYNRVLSHLGQSPCAQFHLLGEQGSSFAGGPMQRVHRRGLSECCKVRYSATLARAHVHNFICSENRGLPSLGELCREFIAEDHRYYLNVVKWGTQPPWPEPMCTDSSAQRTEITEVFLRWGTYAESSSQRITRTI